MNAVAALAELHSVLDRERAAIRRMDSAAVDACTTEKAPLFEAVSVAARAGAIRQGELRQLQVELRRNGVLLAFARDCVRDVLGIGTPKRAQATRGVRISVSG